MTVIVITGTPGTGKTTLAQALAKELGFLHIDVSSIIKERKLSEGYDEERQCETINQEKLVGVLLDMIADGNGHDSYLFDSHLAHYLPNKAVDLCIVTKCDLRELKKRLEERGYSKYKIRENLDAEIFDVCLVEAMEEQEHDVLVVDTTNGINGKKTADDVIEILEKKKKVRI